MMATYDEILKKEQEEAQKEADRKKLELVQQSNAERKQYLNNSTEAIKAAEASTEKAIKETKDQYANAYDANAVQELISRKNVDETMANLGLSRSGMNESEQARISIARGNADNAVRVAEQKAIDALTAELEKIKLQRRQDVSNYLFTSNQELQQNLSAVDAEAKTAAETAAQETYTAEQEAIAEQTAAAQKEAQDIIDTLVSIGVRPDESIIAASGRSGAWVDAKLQEYTVNQQKEQAKAVVSASSGGDSGENLTYFRKRLEAMFDNSQSANAVPYLLQSGLSEAEQERLAQEFGFYGEWNAMYKANNEVISVPSFANKDSAVAYLAKQGITDVSDLLYTESLWNSLKAKAKRGVSIPDVDVTEYNTYSDYLKAYVTFKVLQANGWLEE